jgi:hypothetical protein
MSSTEPPQNGLDRFRTVLHPDVLAEVETWRDDPELGPLYAALRGHTGPISFFDAYAEALVARHLRSRGCSLRLEVPNPAGKRCDFEAERNGEKLYVHLKRVHSDRERPKQLSISPRLRYLERVKRPYVVRVRWHEGLDDEQMQRFVARAASFIARAQVGDELTVRDEGDGDAAEGRELGGVKIVAPWSGSHVSLAIGLPSGFIDETPRIRKLLERAYQQFVPRALNVIIVCSMTGEDVEDFQNALLGSHVERWDETPPRGRRVAHGRDSDGFWHAGRFAESVVVGWFSFAAGDAGIRFRRWHRQGVVVDPEMNRLMEDVFGEDGVEESDQATKRPSD